LIWTKYMYCSKVRRAGL